MTPERFPGPQTPPTGPPRAETARRGAPAGGIGDANGPRTGRNAPLRAEQGDPHPITRGPILVPQRGPWALPAARAAVLGRSGGWCERCAAARGADTHHRRPRGMGGSRNPRRHSPANLLHLCRDCHAWVEANSIESYGYGWKVRHGVLDPAAVPVLIRGVWRYLTDDGRYA